MVRSLYLKNDDMAKRRKLKFLWSSNSPHANSGYSVETRDLLYRFLKDGWPLACIGFFGVEGFYVHLDGGDLIDDRFKGTKLKVYPKMLDPYGSDALLGHARDFGARVVFTMQDIWTLNPNFLDKLNKAGIAWIPYMPIDQEPVSPMILDKIRHAYKIITFSQFGHDALEKHGFASRMIIEGIDLNIFKPGDKAKSRKKLGIPQNAFLFGMIAANKENPPRKGYQEILEALKLFVKNHPEGAIYLHTQQISPNRFPIQAYAKYLGIGKNVYFLDQYNASFGRETKDVVAEINAFDVCMQPSMTEGFGLASIEAQACGIPSIVNNCHSMPELVIPGKTGEICDTNYAWWRNQQGYVYTADVKSLHEKMELWYKRLKDPKKKEQIAKDCRQNALTKCSIDSIVKTSWLPFLEELQEELVPAK